MIGSNTAKKEQVTVLAFVGELLSFIWNGKGWPETLLFPRVAYCYVAGLKLVGVNNSYIAQCALPNNMLIEKFYIFLLIWIAMLIILSGASLVDWLTQILTLDLRTRYTLKHLHRTKEYQAVTSRDIAYFVQDYLAYDGVFLVKVLAQISNTRMASEVVAKLYKFSATFAHSELQHFNEMESTL